MDIGRLGALITRRLGSHVASTNGATFTVVIVRSISTNGCRGPLCRLGLVFFIGK